MSAHLPADQALDEALDSLFAPIARLALKHGLTFHTVEDQLKRAFVSEAYEAHESLAPHRRVSRVAITTGLTRREVGRLMDEISQGLSPRRDSMAEQMAQAWQREPAWRDAAGQPRMLVRQGPGASFEALAWSLTKDVHPRSLLEEMLRLTLVDWDEASDTVRLLPVPSSAADLEKLQQLAGHVADHLSAGVANLHDEGASHLEEALCAGGLPAHAIDALLDQIEAQWEQLVDGLRPQLEALIQESDEALSGTQAGGTPAAAEPGSRQGLLPAGPRARAQKVPQDADTGRRRLRVGLYTYTAPD